VQHGGEDCWKTARAARSSYCAAMQVRSIPTGRDPFAHEIVWSRRKMLLRSSLEGLLSRLVMRLCFCETWRTGARQDEASCCVQTLALHILPSPEVTRGCTMRVDPALRQQLIAAIPHLARLRLSPDAQPHLCR
jgi:hypothetical protein